MEYNDITQHEIEALKHDFNMSDAHAHQSQSPTQRNIISRLPELWYEAENTRQYDMEQRFIHNFFRTQLQEGALRNNNALLAYSSSIAMVITSNYVMKRDITVSMMHPCFDNLTDIFKHMRVPLLPLEEYWLHDPEKIYENLEKNHTGDALFFVDPNNPTGFTLFKFGKRGWEEVIRFCKDKKKLLIIDFCFAPFLLPDRDLDVFDIYTLLEDSGISYIAYEDSGKAWPLQDTKVAILKSSADIFEEIHDIQTAYLLNVSPFILNVVNEYILDSERDNFASLFDLLDRNRSTAQEILKGSLLEPIDQPAKVSVLWCRITDESIHATDLKRYLEEGGVHVVPGTYFFWNDHEIGERFIRIALARDTEKLKEGLQELRILLDHYAPGR